MDLELVLPGHGDPITDHAALIERAQAHARAPRRAHPRADRRRPRTAYELASEMWHNVAVTQAYLTISEVLGHLDLLLDAGRVREREQDGVARFEAV